MLDIQSQEFRNLCRRFCQFFTQDTIQMEIPYTENIESDALRNSFSFYDDFFGPTALVRIMIFVLSDYDKAVDYCLDLGQWRSAILISVIGSCNHCLDHLVIDRVFQRVFCDLKPKTEMKDQFKKLRYIYPKVI